MTVPARRKSDNHVLSVYKFVEDNFADVYGVAVNYGDVLLDVSGESIWVDITFLSYDAGRKGVSLVQFDVYSRVRGAVPGGDEYLEALSRTADELHSAMHVDGIQVYDFSTKTSPVAVAGAKLIVQNSGGTFREPEEDVTTSGFEDGVARRSLTYRLRMVEDASQAPSYYD